MIVSSNVNNQSYSLREKCPFSELFWSTFSHILTECGPGLLPIRTLFYAVIIYVFVPMLPFLSMLFSILLHLLHLHDIRNVNWWRYQCNQKSENRFKVTWPNLQKGKYLFENIACYMRSIFPARSHVFTKSALFIASVIRFSSFTFWSVPRDETTKEVNNLPQLRAVGTIKLVRT